MVCSFISSTVAYIEVAGHEGVPGTCAGGGAAAVVGGEVSLLCLSSGLLGVWTVGEELLEHGCSVSLVCKSKVDSHSVSSKPTDGGGGVHRDEIYHLGWSNGQILAALVEAERGS